MPYCGREFKIGYKFKKKYICLYHYLIQNIPISFKIQNEIKI